jgi:hypothetical protein
MKTFNKISLIIFKLIISIFIVSCSSSKILFTQSLREEYDFTQDEIKNLQYYVSSTITLQRKLTTGERQITQNHQLRVKKGKYIEEVIVEPRTPGICTDVGDDWLSISFEEGSFLDFGAVVNDVLTSGPYNIYAESWNGDIGTLDFNGKQFQAIKNSQNSSLMIDKESLSEVVQKRKVLPGRRLKN